MTRVVTQLGMLFCLQPLVWGQILPAIYPRGILNGASFMSQGLPGGAIARGSAFSIFGRRLGPSMPVQVSFFPLATTLGGVSIKVTQGGASVDAIPIFTSATQINAIMPSTAPLGMVSVQVVYNDRRSNPSPVRVVNSSFGIFSANGAGHGPGILQNFVSAEAQPINSMRDSARPGQVVILWGTGLGPGLGPDNVAPPAGDLPVPVDVFVGGRAARKLYSGRSPCCSSVDQIVFEVPADAPRGCWAPVYVRSENAVTSNVVTMAIGSDGKACVDASNPLAATLIGGGKLGTFMALRAAIREDLGVLKPIEAISDFFGASFWEDRGGAFAFNPLVSLPPAGTCTVYTGAGDMLAGGSLFGTGSTNRNLDAGPPFRMTGPKGLRLLSPLSAALPVQLGYLGSSFPGLSLPDNLFLDPGDFRLAGFGGADVGNFEAGFKIPATLTWTNRDQTTVIDRGRGFTASWNGSATGQLAGVIGANVDLPTNSSAVFLCIAPPGAGSFTVPPEILANIPATRPNLLESKSVVYVGSLPARPAAFSARGVDAGMLLSAFLTGKTVVFR